MQAADKGAEGDLDGRGLTIGIVQARFNEGITNALRDACLAELASLGVAEDDITLVTVPGALELPLVLQTMAQSERFDALVALGCVIRGETYHFELVANESGAGVSRVALDAGLPIANAVLTTEDDDQALARMVQKGGEAGQAAVEMANLQRFLKK